MAAGGIGTTALLRSAGNNNPGAHNIYPKGYFTADPGGTAKINAVVTIILKLKLIISAFAMAPKHLNRGVCPQGFACSYWEKDWQTSQAHAMVIPRLLKPQHWHPLQRAAFYDIASARGLDANACGSSISIVIE